MRDLDQIRADRRPLVYVSDGTSGSDRVGRLLNDIAPLCDEVEKLREHKDALVQAQDGKVTILIDRERDALRAERDEAQNWAELIGQAVVGILGIHEDEVPDQVELLRLAQAEAGTRERLRAQRQSAIDERDDLRAAIVRLQRMADDYTTRSLPELAKAIRRAIEGE